MAAALSRGTLTLVALGPATNVATLLARHPALADRIERIVLVAGRRPGRLLHPGRHWWFHFRDFNVAQDVEAMRVVLASGVPLTLVPFEAAVGATVTGADLDRLRAGDDLARWLAGSSQRWLAFWRGPLIGRDGFHPFDALAVAYAAQPDRFDCPMVRARIGFSPFLAPFGLGRDLEAGADLAGVPARLCKRVAPTLVAWMVDRLRGDAG
jgi:pyrimidine-specific ribonucleoside hydrolase